MWAGVLDATCGPGVELTVAVECCECCGVLWLEGGPGVAVVLEATAGAVALCGCTVVLPGAAVGAAVPALTAAVVAAVAAVTAAGAAGGAAAGAAGAAACALTSGIMDGSALMASMTTASTVMSLPARECPSGRSRSPATRPRAQQLQCSSSIA
ncbi:Retinoblastoma-like protein 2 [Frankliniella fusca]|uniref:Retinoblastoma-like protein 2 n=1 Tax=Frankliniella fusca TaxID=407009 RepID=A0AAE1HGQ6_9NEOP|nr:Retinoblastoma-like protein 2 [Frankliniella fusca]